MVFHSVEGLSVLWSFQPLHIQSLWGAELQVGVAIHVVPDVAAATAAATVFQLLQLTLLKLISQRKQNKDVDSRLNVNKRKCTVLN